MKISLCILLLLSAFTGALCQTFNPNEDNWINDMYSKQVHLLESELLKRISRTPRLQSFNGLMGKKSAKSQISRNRQKFQKIQTFVGLMGKRNVADPGSFYEEIKHSDFALNSRSKLQAWL